MTQNRGTIVAAVFAALACIAMIGASIGLTENGIQLRRTSNTLAARVVQLQHDVDLLRQELQVQQEATVSNAIDTGAVGLGSSLVTKKLWEDPIGYLLPDPELLGIRDRVSYQDQPAGVDSPVPSRDLYPYPVGLARPRQTYFPLGTYGQQFGIPR